MSTRAEISGGAIFLPCTSTQASPLSALTILYGTMSTSFCTTVVVELAADQALDREQRVLRIGDGLALGRLADQHLVVLGEGDDRRRRAIALAVLDHARLAAVHDGDAGVGRAEVDADDSCHGGEAPSEFSGCRCRLVGGRWPGFKSGRHPVSSAGSGRAGDDDPRRPQQPAVQRDSPSGRRPARCRPGWSAVGWVTIASWNSGLNGWPMRVDDARCPPSRRPCRAAAAWPPALDAAVPASAAGAGREPEFEAVADLEQVAGEALDARSGWAASTSRWPRLRTLSISATARR